MKATRRLMVGLLGFLAFLPLASPAHAAAVPADTGWLSLQVTHNWTMNEQPQLDGERLVWQAYDGTDWEILVYDLASGSITQLTDDGIDETDPQLDGDQLLWITHPAPLPPWVYSLASGSPALSLYDFTTDRVEPIPQSEGVQGSPQIAGDLVVWEGGPDAATTDIYVYSLTSRQTRRLTNDAYRQSDPVTDGRYVAFVTHPFQYSELWLFDNETGTLRQLSDVGRTSNTVGRPSVNGGRIAWVESDSRDFYVRVFDTANSGWTTVTRTDDHTLAQPLRSPVLGGESVAWLSWAEPGQMAMPHESPWAVMVADLSTLASRKVADAFGGDLWMQDDGKLLAYTYFGWGPRLRVYDLETGAETAPEADPEGGSTGGPPARPIEGARGSGGPPSLSGGRVAFAVYQFVNRVYDDSDIVLGFRGASQAAPASPSPPLRVFADLAGSPYEAAVQKLADRGLFRGYRKGGTLLARPDAAVLRWQFLRMLLDIEGVRWEFSSNQTPFLDLGPRDDVHMSLHEVVEAGLELGITRGTTDHSFSPYAPITWGQALTMVTRAVKTLDSGATEPSSGSEGDLGSPMTRGEAAQMLAVLLEER